jgi:Flp pilus assembly pilin Flp
VQALISSVIRDDRGQGLLEYSLIIALVAMTAVVSLRFFGGQVNNSLFNVILNAMSNI